jgi:hypothetical protein
MESCLCLSLAPQVLQEIEQLTSLLWACFVFLIPWEKGLHYHLPPGESYSLRKAGLWRRKGGEAGKARLTLTS